MSAEDARARLAGLTSEERVRLEQRLQRRQLPAEPATPAAATEAPLSFAQEEFWVLERLQPGSAANLRPVVCSLDGPLDRPALLRAIHAVVARHDVLRTTYAERHGTPTQVIGGAGVPIEVIDLSDRASGGGTAGERDRLVREKAREPFDLERGPVARVCLIAENAGRYTLIWVTHHIAFDGTSERVLLRDLAAAYDREVGSPRADVAPVPRAYLEHARRQHAADERLIEQSLRYWEETLAGAPPVCNLPTDHPRPAERTDAGAEVALWMSRDVEERLRRAGAPEHATPFMTVLAAYAVLLHRYSGDRDVVVAYHTAGRPRPEDAAVIGNFIGTLPLRIAIDPGQSFRGLLAAVRRRVLDAFAHQDAPFRRIVDRVERRPDASRRPLTQLLFQLRERPDGAALAGGVRLTRLDVPRGVAAFDVALDVVQTGRGLRCGFEYRTDLFASDTMQRFAEHFVRLCERLADDPDVAVERVPVLSEPERAHIVAIAQGPRAPIPRDAVHVAFCRQAAASPQSIAVDMDSGDQSITYAELDRRSAAVRDRLVARGVQRGDVVGLHVDRTPHMMAGLLGILRAGAAYLPLDPSYPDARLRLMAGDAGPRLVISDAAARWAGCDVLDSGDTSEAPAAADGHASGDDLAYVIFTSGSTGRPKAVEITHGAVMNLIASFRRTPGLHASDRLLAITTIGFDISVTELLAPLVAGATVVLASREAAVDPAILARLLTDGGITVCQATPSTWRMLVDAGWQGAPRLRAYSGAEALPRDLASALLDRCAEVWNLYGPTETTVWSACCRVEAGAGTVPIGTPIANTTMLVLDEQRQVVALGVHGEVYIGGAGLARGYRGRPDLTAEAFVSAPSGDGASRMYRTRDRGRLRSDGAIELTGRADFQVKIRGASVEPAEIEAALCEHAGISEAIALVHDDPAGRPTLTAYYVPREPDPGARAVRAFLQDRLPAYMVPALFVPVPAIPRLPNGKVDRPRLPAPVFSPPDLAPRAPADARERLVVSICEEVLGTAGLGVDDDFFEAGGHSLLATRAVARLEQATGIRVPLAVFFRHSTPARLAAWLRASTAGTDVP